MIFPDIVSAQKFLKTLCQTLDIADPSVVFQTFDETGQQRKGLSGWCDGTLAQHLSMLLERNAAGAGVFVTINPGGRSTNHITGIRACYADADGPLARDVPLPPSMTVQTSPAAYALHHYWLLKPGEDKSRWKGIQEKIAKYLGADAAMNKLAGVMRLPGFFWRKAEPAFRVRLIACEPTRIYTLDQLEQAFSLNGEAKSSEKEKPSASPDASPSQDAAKAARTANLLRGWFAERKIAFTEKINKKGETVFNLDCPLNPEHKGKAQITAMENGFVWAKCFHTSCGGNSATHNRFREFSREIGGWRSAGSFEIGDHAEMAEQLLNDLQHGNVEVRAWGNVLYRYESNVWKAIGDQEIVKTVNGYSGWSAYKGRVKIKASDPRAVTDLATRMVPEPGFEHQAAGVAFINAFVTVDDDGTIHTHKHRPEHFTTFRLPFLYGMAPDPFFLQNLHEWFEGEPDIEERIALLQEFAGASLLGIAPRFEQALVMLGGGGNAKSVFTRMLVKLFPPESVCHITPQEFGQPYFRAMLFRKRLNVVFELPEKELLDSTSLKAIVSSERLTARQVRERPIEFRPRAGHLFLANELPSVADATHGFWRRMLLLDWKRTFAQDKAYEDKLQSCVPSLASWAIEGAARLLAANAYTKPSSMGDRIDVWKRDSNPVATWLHEHTERLPAPVLGIGDLEDIYRAYQLWALDHGHMKMSVTTFKRRLEAMKVPFINGTDTAVRKCYYAVRLLDPPAFFASDLHPATKPTIN